MESMYVNLQLPTHEITVKSYFTSIPLMIPRSLELDGMVDLAYYSYINPNNVGDHFIAYIEEKENSNSILSQIITYLTSFRKIITASSFFHLDSIFFLIPLNSQYLGLYSYTIPEVLGDSIELYARYITDIKLGKSLLFQLSLEFTSNVSTIVTESKKIYAKCENFDKNCAEIFNQLKDHKAEIRSMAEKFDIQESWFKKFECLDCKTNYKDLLFLPCGHSTICNECLKSDYKITANLPIVESMLICSICNERVELAMQYTF